MSKTFDFDKVDSDGDGFISPQQFKKQCKEKGELLGIQLTDEQVQEAINAMDKDKDGNFSIKKVFHWMEASGFFPETQGLGGPWITTIMGANTPS